jgi:hypothetical protein
LPCSNNGFEALDPRTQVRKLVVEQQAALRDLQLGPLQRLIFLPTPTSGWLRKKRNSGLGLAGDIPRRNSKVSSQA